MIIERFFIHTENKCLTEVKCFLFLLKPQATLAYWELSSAGQNIKWEIAVTTSKAATLDSSL